MDYAKGITTVFITVLLMLTLLSCGDGDSALEASGTLEALQVRVPARSVGVALEVLAEEGLQVEAGDVLARLDDASLLLLRDKARGGRDMAAASLNLVLDGARREDLDQARDGLASAEENHRLAVEEADRLRALIDAGSVSRQQLDRAESAETLSESARSQAVSALAKLESGARESEIAQARAALTQAEAVLALAERNLTDTYILSPISGTVLYRMLEPGEWAAPGLPVFVVSDISTLRLRVYIPEPHLARVCLGQQVEVRMDGTSSAAMGRVSWISPEAEFTPKNIQTRDERAKQVFAVRIEVENPDGIMKAGMPADALFLSAGSL